MTMMKKELRKLCEDYTVNNECGQELYDNILILFNSKMSLTTFEKAKAASKWADERSEGNREVDRQCYYDYLMGMEQAEIMLK